RVGGDAVAALPCHQADPPAEAAQVELGTLAEGEDGHTLGLQRPGQPALEVQAADERTKEPPVEAARKIGHDALGSAHLQGPDHIEDAQATVGDDRAHRIARPRYSASYRRSIRSRLSSCRTQHRAAA